MLQAMFLTVLNMSITAGAAIVLVLPARLLLRRAPRVFSYALWAVVLFRLLCPVSLTSELSLFGILEAPAVETGPVGHMAYVPLPGDDGSAPAPDRPRTDRPAAEPPSAPSPTAAADSALSLLSAAGALWLSGAAAMLLLNTVRWVSLRRRLFCAVPLRENIYLADHIPVPFVLGLVRPRIYLPSSLTGAEQLYVIRHEQHHIRRGDPIFKLLAFAALCVHWFNPLVWLAFALAGTDMEMSCDEAVLRQSGSEIRADYSLSLLRCSTGKSVFIGSPLAFGEGDTRGRIEHIMKYKRSPAFAVVLAALVCLALTACLSFNPPSGRETSAPAPGTSDAPPSGEASAPPPDASDTPSSGETADTAVLRAEQVVALQDYLVLDDDSTGTLSEMVYVGKYCALVTLKFTYEQDGAHLMVRDIVEARAENIAGWWSVQSDIQIDTQRIEYSKNDMEAVIPFTYYASIGEGWAEYSDVAVVDLSTFDAGT